ncbi:hypothetical protein M6B40_001210 [Vibrio metschnikovii]|uniref:hypothetical protein n=1 Tax=Vibrio metschnikovii TaxID=28172 RepID=UPI002FCBEA2A|nr:hypothetical protein [Vibrio metschnikovii]
MYIFGASYPDVIKVFLSNNKNKFANIFGFIDDVIYPSKKEFMGKPILGASTYFNEINQRSNIINNVHSSPKARFLIAEKIDRLGHCSVSLVHNNVFLEFSNVGVGCFVHQCDIGANVKIGNHVSIKIGAIISHDTTINDYAFIGPGVTLCGHVRVQRGAYIGAGAVVKEHVNIGAGATIGAGSVVLKDVEPFSVVVGVPAKKIKDSEYFDFGVSYDTV